MHVNSKGANFSAKPNALQAFILFLCYFYQATFLSPFWTAYITAMTTPPSPLFPTLKELQAFDFIEYPQLKSQLEQQPWQWDNWQLGRDFLLYIGANKSIHTFNRFRTEIERFLLWLADVRQLALADVHKKDVLAYIDFCAAPDLAWLGSEIVDKFIRANGVYSANPKWRPLILRGANAADFKNYQPSQQSLTACFTALIAFYKYLMYEEKTAGNPAQLAKRDCRHFIKDAQVKDVRRLSQQQWDYVIDTAQQLAEQDSDYERSLFLIVALKVLFLRISELASRPAWQPVMSHFWQDDGNNWWLKVYGKGRKIRDVTVPDSFLPYLTRYRHSRNLSALPRAGEMLPIIAKQRGRGGMGARQLARLVSAVFKIAYDNLCRDHGQSAAQKLQQASSHWLRHTGASMEIERGRALKDLSEDLGHASMATTDSIYVQTENRLRAKSGKNRPIK